MIFTFLLNANFIARKAFKGLATVGEKPPNLVED